MASDYGDDAGEKMIEDFMSFGERMGERAMYDRAKRMEAAFEKARDAARSTPAEVFLFNKKCPECALKIKRCTH